MPGYYIHLAVCNNEALKERGFVLGVESPDILKKHLKLFGKEGALKKYEELKVDCMPDYEELKIRIYQKEFRDRTDGLHYGISSNPNIKEYWNRLSKQQKSNPFYIGYLWHLITDKLIYKELDLDMKFRCDLDNYSGDNIEEFKKRRKEKLHTDWDKTNELIRLKYKVDLTDEIRELNVVGFNKDTSLTYVDYDLICNIIDKLRRINPLNYDLDTFLDKLYK